VRDNPFAGLCRREELNLSEADELADTQLRFPAFLLATHYWEGRWLMDMANIDNLQEEKGRKGAKTIKARWLRRMKLTPCVVMTCFMLPHHMLIREHVSGKKYDNGYLYNFADLLIVDEAGQVLPEVAAASFALAKKALVIGDTEQIAPIWNSLPCIDIGNMVEEHILPEGSQEELTEAYALVCESGKSAASGSVMKIAQFNSRYQYDPDLARGCICTNTVAASITSLATVTPLVITVSCSPNEGKKKGQYSLQWAICI
jgi:hypothetical protein